MWGAIKTILGSGDVIEKGFALADSIHTSDVEEIEAKTKSKTDLLKAYAPFKIAQRFLALMFTTVFLTCFVVSLVFILHAYITDNLIMVITAADGTQHDASIITAIRELLQSYKLDWIMGTIVLFYFGGGMAEGMMERRTEQKQRQQSGTTEPPKGR